MNPPCVAVEELWVRYRQRRTPALADVTFTADPGECLALIGPSGAGKSTLLAVLTGLIAPTRGDVRVAGENLRGISVRSLRQLRQNIGLVSQRGDLVPSSTLLANVALAVPGAPMSRSRRPDRARMAAAMAALERLAVDDVAHARVDEVSGGQRQRAAVARILVRRPKLVLADEPAASVDVHSAELVHDALTQLSASGSTLIVATHDLTVLQRADRAVALASGQLQFDQHIGQVDSIALQHLYAEERLEPPRAPMPVTSVRC